MNRNGLNYALKSSNNNVVSSKKFHAINKSMKCMLSHEEENGHLIVIFLGESSNPNNEIVEPLSQEHNS